MHKTTKEFGFTLVELLIALLIISIISAIALLSLQPIVEQRQVNIALQRFQQTIHNAQDRAILQPAILGLIITKNGYHFYRYQKNKWAPLSRDRLSNPKGFVHFKKTTVKLKNDSLPDKNQCLSPQIIFLPDGEITTFTIKLTDHNGKRHVLRY